MRVRVDLRLGQHVYIQTGFQSSCLLAWTMYMISPCEIVHNFREHRESVRMLRRLGTRRLTSAADAPVPLTYFSAWFCPFAHRATLALEHHSGAVPYKWQESLGWEAGKAPTGRENFEAGERADWYYHWKSPELLAANPLGMVPTLLDPSSGNVVVESQVAIEFIDELAAANGSSASPLLPPDLYERARARVAADRVNKTVCSAYYRVLVRTDHGERLQAFSDLLEGLRDFTRGLRGHYYSGDDGLGLVDCVLLPYAYRLYVLAHYRGPEFEVPGSGEDGLWDAYQGWLSRCLALPHVARTLPDKQRYLEHVKKYAEGKARSKVGNAVRSGRAAHEYDDVIDGEEAPPGSAQRT